MPFYIINKVTIISRDSKSNLPVEMASECLYHHEDFNTAFDFYKTVPLPCMTYEGVDIYNNDIYKEIYEEKD